MIGSYLFEIFINFYKKKPEDSFYSIKLLDILYEDNQIFLALTISGSIFFLVE